MKRILGLGLVAMLAAGCGDLFMGSKGKKSLSINAISCTLDTEAFSFILEKNIKSDILCLQESIHTFIELVKTDRPGYVSQNTLVNFIQTGPIDLGGSDIVPLVESVFDLTKLILGGEKGYISKEDFDRLVAFLIEFNKNIYPVYEIFKNDRDLTLADYLRSRNKIADQLALIAQEIKLLLKLSRPNLDRLNLEIFLDRFFMDHPKTAEKIKSMLFLKRVFIGGETESLTHMELEDALDKLPELGEVAYGLVKLNSFGFKDDAQSMVDKVYLPDLKTIERNLHFDDGSYEALFTVYDIFNVIENMEFNIGIDFSLYAKELMVAKYVLLGSGGEIFSSEDLFRLLEHLNNVLEEGSFFFRAYELHSDLLDSKEALPQSTRFERIEPKNSREEEFLRHFSEIANNYKLFKGSSLSPVYSFDFNRNPLAMLEISAFEYLIKLVMDEYGQADPEARGGFHMTLEQSARLIGDLKVFLRDQGIINIGYTRGGEVQGIADNMVLMSTLFQYQSDGCGDRVCMEVPELNEFLMGLFTALNIKDFFTEELQRLCGRDVDEYGRINPDCFRKNFINVLEAEIPEEGKALRDYMPLLYTFLQDMISKLPPGAPPTDSRAYTKFLVETESFTRTCRYFDDAETEPVPMKANDAFAVFAGMLNVESTMLKFDLNQNNRLDAFGRTNEVWEAYRSTYRGAIQGMVADQSPALVRFSWQIFQYLIKYGKVPEASGSSAWHFVKFLFSRYKGANASRTTIATILKVLGEQNGGDNKFKCEECLRDPTTRCVPVTCHESNGELICEEDPWD